MLAGLYAYNSAFLLDLNNTQNRISQTNEQISSGIRVNKASDDPGDIAAILNYQDQASQINASADESESGEYSGRGR